MKRNENNKKGDTVARVIVVTIIAALSLSTIGYHAANGNTSLLKSFEREILVTFVSYSAMFFLYTMYNFIGLLHDKTHVYKLVFKPLKLSTYHMYMMGLVACMALFFKDSKKPYYQAVSGYYNSIADSYLIQKEYKLATTFYEFGRAKDPFNHRSNVTIASLAINDGNLDKAISHYKLALSRDGSEHSYIQLSNIYNQQGNYFDALFILQEGINKFPPRCISIALKIKYRVFDSSTF